MRFRYDALEGTEIRTGEIEAADPYAARLLLRRAKLEVIELAPSAKRASAWLPSFSLVQNHLRTRRRSTKAELFFGLSMMLESGLPLREAVRSAAESSKNTKPTRASLMDLYDSVSEGNPIGEAMNHHAGWFDEIECAVVAASHHSGTLPEALQRLGERLTRSGEINAKITSALAYPSIVLIVTLVVVVLLSTVTIPPITGILTDAGVEIPWLTDVILKSGRLLTSGWIFAVVPLGVAGAIGSVALLQTNRSGDQRSRLIAKALPVSILESRIASFARGMADLVDSGIPFVEAMHTIAPCIRGIGSHPIRSAIRNAAVRLESGSNLEQAFADVSAFPPELRRMLAIGQDSGDIGPPLRRLADRYESRCRRSIDRLTAVLEPVAIIGMSCVVGTVVLAAVLPLVKLQELI